MARRTPIAEPQRAMLTVEQMRRGILLFRRRITDLEAFEPQEVQMRWAPEVKALEASIEEALVNVFGSGTVEYERYRRATVLDSGPVSMSFEPDWISARGHGYAGRGDDLREAQQYMSEGKAMALALLRQAVRGLEEAITDQSAASLPPAEAKEKVRSRRIFLVHGHDDAARETVARFLSGAGFEPIILHEQPNQGRTVIEKVEACSDVGFAVVLLTPDDTGNEVDGSPRPRARQNVVLELGYFIGCLGRDRVCALKKGDLEIPSDFGGVVYETFDAGNGWKLALARELEAAEYDIDWNKVMRA